MSSVVEEHLFLGRGWSFPPEFRKAAEVTKMVEGEEDIYQSLKILMQTALGERIHRYDFGCGISRFVYEEFTLTTQTLLRNTIEKAILRYESRITLEEINFDTTQAKEGIWKIGLQYRVRQTNRRSNRVFPFYLREGTEIKEI